MVLNSPFVSGYSDTGDLVPFADVLERRYRQTALGDSHEAAGVERAAGRGIQRTGHFALQDDALAAFLHERVGYRHGGKQGACVRM
jgi:hypothetical protein